MSEDPLMLLVAFPAAAYVIGSTPFGVLIARAAGVNLRQAGSGNVGATNVGRTVGKEWGCLCFFLDVAKGLIPTLLTVLWLRDGRQAPSLLHQAAWLGVGFGAIAGHVFSFYLRFRGGKGVATALGVVLGIFPYFTWPGLCAFGLWMLVTLSSRYVSLGSIVAAVAFVPLFAAFNWPPTALWPLGIFAGAMAALILVRHRSNIRRLLKGTENKIATNRGDRSPQETKS